MVIFRGDFGELLSVVDLNSSPTPKLYVNTDCDIQIELYSKLTFDISSLNTINNLF